jgi:hypothetical protein
MELREEQHALAEANRTNSSLGEILTTMARDRKCTHAVMRYAHHLK